MRVTPESSLVSSQAHYFQIFSLVRSIFWTFLGVTFFISVPAMALGHGEKPKPPENARSREALVALLRQDCGSCHGLTLKGGLGRSLEPERMKIFGHQGLKAIILNGIDHTAMPSWKGQLREDEAAMMADLLLEGLPPLQFKQEQEGGPSLGARGTGDLGIIVERASGSLLVVDTSEQATLGQIGGLGDLSHASAVFDRSGRFAYIFGRDGGLTKVDILDLRIVRRVMQGGNSIGGAISQDGRWIAVSNYEPGGVRIFDSVSLDMVADIPALSENGKTSKTVGLVESTGNRFIWSLFDQGEIWVARFNGPKDYALTKYPNAGALPYDAMITPNGRFYVAGLFGEDGMSMLDLWQAEPRVRKIIDSQGKGEEKLPVYKMPHLEGWAMTTVDSFLPAVGKHEVLVIQGGEWQVEDRIAVKGQPVFVVARPDGRQLWVNFAYPDNQWVQIIDVPSRKVIKTLEPGPGVMHLEFSPKGEMVWISVRDENRVDIYDAERMVKVGELPAEKPSGIFFTHRAGQLGK